ncbi:MAG: HAMP domain-containing sensor histidine kinase, partial [Arcobacteraceae bacterium]
CDEWDWTIGSGFYTDDLNMIIEQKTKELTRKNDDNIRTIIIIFCVLIIIVILLSLLLSYAIKQRFEHYKTKVKEKDQLLFQQSKMAAMGEMIENIAHQWRQPLSIISTASSGLKVQQEYSMMTKELLNNGLDNISESVEYLSQTIDDFRNFYKEDKLKKSFNVSQTIQKAIHLLHSRFKKKNIELVVQKSEVELYGLQNELMQVFMNILNNARDVLENMELERKLIFVNVKKLENSIKISFYDNGNGVDEEIISKLFDYKFTTKEQQNGTGVGLYMSKLIVEKSGGTIEVHNKEYEYQGKNYKGAEFIITLTF